MSWLYNTKLNICRIYYANNQYLQRMSWSKFPLSIMYLSWTSYQKSPENNKFICLEILYFLPNVFSLSSRSNRNIITWSMFLYAYIYFTNPLQDGTSHVIECKLSLTSWWNVSFDQRNFDSNYINLMRKKQSIVILNSIYWNYIIKF